MKNKNIKYAVEKKGEGEVCGEKTPSRKANAKQTVQPKKKKKKKTQGTQNDPQA